MYTQRVQTKSRAQGATGRLPGLSRKAYTQLKKSIVEGQLAEGEVLFEVHLADKFGMSRTPIREVLKALAFEGLVEELPGRGYAVPRRSIDDLREFYELREILESSATRLAAQKATDSEIAELERIHELYKSELNLERWNSLGSDFHDAITKASRNQRLASILDSLNAQIKLSRRPMIQATKEWREIAINDHQRILDAIRHRNEPLAQSAAAEHIRHSYVAMLKAYMPTENVSNI
jgi:DNA-binding GntR family transcriptional regulator